ncbi:MAG: hypothetical protein V1843_01220, partial [bacterium]
EVSDEEEIPVEKPVVTAKEVPALVQLAISTSEVNSVITLSLSQPIPYDVRFESGKLLLDLKGIKNGITGTQEWLIGEQKIALIESESALSLQIPVKEQPLYKISWKQKPSELVVELIIPKPLEKNAYTGLVIDARDLGLKPARTAKIFDQNGKDLSGPLLAPTPLSSGLAPVAESEAKTDAASEDAESKDETAVMSGTVEYYEYIAEALSDKELVGDNPLIIRAIAKGKDPYGADVVIFNSDAKLLEQYGSLIKEKKVVFII